MARRLLGPHDTLSCVLIYEQSVLVFHTAYTHCQNIYGRQCDSEALSRLLGYIASSHSDCNCNLTLTFHPNSSVNYFLYGATKTQQFKKHTGWVLGKLLLFGKILSDHQLFSAL